MQVDQFESEVESLSVQTRMPMGSEKSDATVTNTFQKTWTKISKILYYSTISRKNLS